MNSVILQIASKYLRWILLAFAILALLRGHNAPGGGFIGGLLAGLAIVFRGFAYSIGQVKNELKSRPMIYTGLGLLFILLSFLPGIFSGNELMTGSWVKIPVPMMGDLKLGTPLLFDIGVFFGVIGVTLLFVFSLTKKE